MKRNNTSTVARLLPYAYLSLLLIAVIMTVWYPALGFWFRQGWEATWLQGPCGGGYTFKCLMQGHAMVYFLNYVLFGWNASGWYATTIVLHIIAVLTGFALVTRLSGSRRLGFVVAFVYSANVTYHDVIDWGSFNGLYALMMCSYLLATYAYTRIEHIKTSTQLLWYEASLLIFFLALTVRESSLALPGFIIAADVYKHGIPRTLKSAGVFAARIVPYGLIILVYFLFIRPYFGGSSYDYIDPMVQYRVKLLASGNYIEFAWRSILLFGLFAAPQVIPHKVLNFIAAKVAVQSGVQTGLMYYWLFPAIGFVYAAALLWLLWKHRKTDAVRNLLFGFFWFLIPTVLASLAITFTDEGFMRPLNDSTPARWRYFSFFGTAIFWSTLAIHWAPRTASFFNIPRRRKTAVLVTVATAYVLTQMYFIRHVQKELNDRYYRVGKQFHQSFHSFFPQLPQDYVFYAYPGSSNLKDYMAEWHHIRHDRYPNLMKQRGITWMEEQMGTLLARYEAGAADLEQTFFLDFDANRMLRDRTQEARDMVRSLGPVTAVVNKSFTPASLATVPFDPGLHVEVPRSVEIRLSTHNVQDTRTIPERVAPIRSTLQAYTREYIGMSQRQSVEVCDTQPVGTAPGVHVRPENLIDGTLSVRSYWVANCRPAWITLDLGSVTDVSGLGFHTVPGPSHIPADYVIEGSIDGETWVEFLHETGNKSADRIHVFPDGSRARYIRLTVDHTGEEGMLTLTELEVFPQVARPILHAYGTYSSLVADRYEWGGQFVHVTWSVEPDPLLPEERVSAYRVHIPVVADNAMHTYDFRINENEFFSGAGDFLTKRIVSLDVGTGGPVSGFVESVTVRPDIPTIE